MGREVWRVATRLVKKGSVPLASSALAQWRESGGHTLKQSTKVKIGPLGKDCLQLRKGDDAEDL